MPENRLKHFRIIAGVGVEQLAAMADVSSSTVYELEQGNGNPQKRVREQLAKVLGVKEDDLFPVVMGRGPYHSRVPPYVTTEWTVDVTCPKCRGRYRLIVLSGALEPDFISCPHCGFTQTIKMERA